MSPSRELLAVVLFLAVHVAYSQEGESQKPETSSIGYPTVDAALQALQSKDGVVVSRRDGWTIIDDSTGSDRSLWSFTPPEHPAHPAAVKRTVHESNGSVWIDMTALCQAEKEPCDTLIEEFKTLNEKIRDSMSQQHPRHDEAVAFATNWLELLEAVDFEGAFSLLSDPFKASTSMEEWQDSLVSTRQRLGELESRRLRRVVWYQDPADAPLPGTYAAVEFDSVYKNLDQHFQYLILHSLSDEPFRVMRHESTEIAKGQMERANQ